MSPDTVCEGDAFGTEILLDARASSHRLTPVPVPAPPDAEPLRFEWRFEGDELQHLEGGDTDDHLRVAVAGAQPLVIHLRVETAEGGVAETFETLSITRPGDDSLHGFVCANDDECGPCRACDPESQRCVL